MLPSHQLVGVPARRSALFGSPRAHALSGELGCLISAVVSARRRGKKSLFIRRDATLRISRALHRRILEQPLKNDSFNKQLDGGTANSGIGRLLLTKSQFLEAPQTSSFEGP